MIDRDLVIARTDLVSLVADDGHRLKAKGREFVIVCPFHEDSSPSCSIVPHKRMWHCFGCGLGGTAIDWVMHSHGLSAGDALRLLAQRAGIAVDGVVNQGVKQGGGPTQEELERRARKAAEEAAEEDAKSMTLARKIWEAAKSEKAGTGPVFADGSGPNHERARAYFAKRGVPLHRLPGGTLPLSLRYDGDCRRGKQDGDAIDIGEKVPAVVCCVALGKVIQGVQRIYLDVGGEDRKLSGGPAKLGAGVLGGGGAVRLVTRPMGKAAIERGVLVVTEGIETGLAVAAMLHEPGDAAGACKAGVWACVSAGGMERVVLGPEIVDPEHGGWCKRVIIAADWDELKPRRKRVRNEVTGEMEWQVTGAVRRGTEAAWALARRLTQEHPHLVVQVAIPEAAVATEVVELRSAAGGGLPVDGGIDWLDVVAHANALDGGDAGVTRARARFFQAAESSAAEMARVRDEYEAMLRAAAWAARAGVARDEFGVEISADGSEVLDEEVLAAWEIECDDGGRPILEAEPVERAMAVLKRAFAPHRKRLGAWPVRHDGNDWLLYQTKPWPRWVTVSEDVLAAAIRYALWGFVVWRKGDKCYAPAALTERAVRDIMHAMLAFVAVHGVDAEGKRIGKQSWLPADMDIAGRPTFATSFSYAGSKRSGPIDPKRVLEIPEGLVDLDAFVRGEWRVIPHTERWFSQACIPWSVDGARMQELLTLKAGEGMLDESKVEYGKVPVVDFADADALGLGAPGGCPQYMAFLSHMVRDDTAAIVTLQEFGGYCLLADYPFQKCLWLQGVSGSGKGTYTNVMSLMVGDDLVCQLDFGELSGQFTMASTKGRRVCIIPELHVGRMTDKAAELSVLKSLTGGDAKSTSGKYEDKEHNQRLGLKVILTPNEEPNLPDSSAALGRRILHVQTSAPPLVADSFFMEKLHAEMPGILRWHLFGLRRLLRNRGFTSSVKMAARTRGFERSASPVKAWLEDQCVVGKGNAWGKADMLKGFNAYWKSLGNTHEWGPDVFGRALIAAVAGVSAEDRGKGSGRVYFYEGVRPMLESFEPETVVRLVVPGGPGSEVDDGRNRFVEWNGKAWEVIGGRPVPIWEVGVVGEDKGVLLVTR